MKDIVINYTIEIKNKNKLGVENIARWYLVTEISFETVIEIETESFTLTKRNFCRES